jgi:penicillin-binding protein 1A
MRARAQIENRADGGVLYWTLKMFAFFFLFLLVAIMVTVVAVYSYFAASAPEPPDLRQYAQTVPGVSRVYAADDTVMAEYAEEWREVVPYDQIPRQLVQAFLAAEDHAFFQHRGMYFKGIARAVWRNVVAGDFEQGGSTITQQVAKQFLGAEKSLTRKAREAIVARRLEARYSKEAILSTYLNQIFLGNGAHGVKAAAHRYFGKDLPELTLAENALLAGLAKAPSRYSPAASPKAALERRNDVLDKMARYGFVTQADADASKALPIELSDEKDSDGLSPYFADHVRRLVQEKYGSDFLWKRGVRIETTVEPVTDAWAQDSVDYTARWQDKRQGWRGAEAFLDSEQARVKFRERAHALYGDGPLDPNRRYLALVEKVESQRATVSVGKNSYLLPIKHASWAHPWSKTDFVNDQKITELGRTLLVGDVVWVRVVAPVTKPFTEWFLAGPNPRWAPPVDPVRAVKLATDWAATVTLEQVPHPQGALFTADHETGYVVAMAGGTDHSRSVFNRATQACRQPGSTYKPIYYSAALDQGYGYDTELEDVPTKEIDPVTGEVWVPENFDETQDVKVNLEYALVFSKNVPSVALFNRVGANDAADWARKLGFTTKIIADKALALGASCTLLSELTRAFAIFARNGRWVDWVYVKRVIDRDGQIVEDNTRYYDPMLTASERIDRLQATAGVLDRQAISARTGYLTSKLLRQVIKFGFASILRATGINAAGKTGTSSATMDTLFVAYTSRWITAAWLGDDMRERPLGRDDAAYMTVVPMWSRYMAHAAKDHPNGEIPWSIPPGVSPTDRGDHTKGTRLEMDLTYRKTGTHAAPDPPAL